MKRVKDRIAGSLSIKIFLLTAVLLILISLFTYFCIVKFLPVTYQNELEENLQKGPGAARTKSRAQGYDSGKIFQISQHMKKF